MIEFFPPSLEHFGPLFVQIAQMGLILPRWGLILPRIPPPTPVVYSAVIHPFWRCVSTQNTPKPTPKHPFSWPELESGQNELPSGQPGPQLGKLIEKWTKNFQKLAKLLFIFIIIGILHKGQVEASRQPTCSGQQQLQHLNRQGQ